MKVLLGIFIFCNWAFFTQAQRVCGTVAYTQQILTTNPSIQNSYNKVENQITVTASRPGSDASRDTADNEIIYIPVVIHVLYKSAEQNISEAQIRSQLDALNKDYRKQNEDKAATPAVFKPFAADTRIMFCLAQVDPQGRRTSGIIHKQTSRDFFITDD